ncbi:MAG: hypothetical protein CM1200mP38_6790 [Dehalococcoidia bacterium]|nr:MAG: hypothetical protein CM1200mP38_6790 [Dehalococcoidia bacterium]
MAEREAFWHNVVKKWGKAEWILPQSFFPQILVLEFRNIILGAALLLRKNKPMLRVLIVECIL